MVVTRSVKCDVIKKRINFQALQVIRHDNFPKGSFGNPIDSGRQ